ncbi:acyltransferase [Desulfoferrobacter suflitae]|uniref:acyltransferase n=1 Tax=Desulfoferrobacter suflitae TaxID=2865782 RepID=UPI002164DB22|nr:acyltransferase [Desulfoferrobacter suflitae]MCK8603144.1 acyltransferase [Desulfoferrobacter suflitae]
MLHLLPPPVLGTLTFVLLTVNTLFFAILVMAIVPFKVALPGAKFKHFSYGLIESLVQTWVDGNTLIFHLTQKIEWRVQGLHENLKRDGWYLIIANHRSWADIIVLQTLFNRRIPFPKFFIKQQLLYFPLLGFIWWGMDYPFMKRYSKAYLKKHPEKQGKDLETTRRACEKFKHTPVTILNFLEGTRFSQTKRVQQNSPFRHLLLPKAGGIAFVLSAMGERFKEILDVTIVYPVRNFSFWHMLSGRLPRIEVRVDRLAIPQEALIKDYLTDADFRVRFQTWVNQVWQHKERLIEDIRVQTSGTANL